MATEVTTGVLLPREPAVDLVKIISEGTYTSFPQALKEFISNAYDADATRVDITIDEEANAIAIRDNGIGMSLVDFRDYFASIARPGKAGARSVRGRTRLGRPKIGRFGIGSLAVVGTASRFVVRSVKRLTEEGFEASIQLDLLQKQFERGEDLSKHWKFPYKKWAGEAAATHFTEIRIEGLREDIRSILTRPGTKTTAEFFESTRLLSGVEELEWQLGIICPAAYTGGYPVPSQYLDRGRDRILISRSRRLLRDNFSVFLNGRPIRRQISLPRYDPRNLRNPVEGELLNRRGTGFDVQCVKSRRGSPVRYNGYIFVQAAQVFPQELRGLLVRLRGVAVGWHRTFDLGAIGMATMVPTLSGELWVEGLEEALQFDRESFREDHPLFQFLRSEVEKIVRAEATRFRARSAQRTSEFKKLKPRKRKGRRPTYAVTRPTTVPQPAAVTLPPLAPPVSATAPARTESFLPEDVFEHQPDFMMRLIPQINGCWEKEYYEACAMVVRRLVETVIIYLYAQRGWLSEVRDPTTKDFFTLKALVNKVCGDPRVALERRIQDGLKELKELGDIATHDFRVRIRRSDLENLRLQLRVTCERLLFITTGMGP